MKDCDDFESHYARGWYHESKKNYEKAMEHYLLAANQNFSHAQFGVAELYFNGTEAPDGKIGKIPPNFGAVFKNYPKAFEFYCYAAKQGHARALYHVGLMYMKGLSVERNSNKAIEFYQRSANQGYSKAQAKIASVFEKAANKAFD